MTKEKPLSEIARQAWLDCPLDGDHWKATVDAVEKAVLEKAIAVIKYEAQFFDANGKTAANRLTTVLQRLGDTE